MDNIHNLISCIQRQYFQAVHNKDFGWEELKSANKQVDQSLILNETYLHPLNKRFPLSDSYNLKFLKTLLAIYEDKNWEICDELCSAITDITARKIAETNHSYKSYFLSCGKAVTLCESTKFLSEGTTGLNTWQAGLFLSNWLVKNNDIIYRKNVLELGCGVGLTGLVSLHCCHPRNYIFTDYHESVLQKLQENLKTNGFIEKHAVNCFVNRKERIGYNSERVSPETTLEQETDNCICSGNDETFKVFKRLASCEDEMSSRNEEYTTVFSKNCESVNENISEEEKDEAVVAKLDWQNPIPQEVWRYSPDIILASDVIFDPAVIESLVKVIKTLLMGGKQKSAYVASTIRNEETYHKFLSSLDKFGVSRTLISNTSQNDSQNLFIYKTDLEINLLKLEI